MTGVTAQLFQTARFCEFAVLAYCVMPDHLHALVEARSERSDVATMVRQFTQATECAYRQHTQKSLWQSGYHERILRDNEASDRVARYVLENPVRSGLCRHVGEYPFAWSDVYDLESLLTTDYRATHCPTILGRPFA